MSITEDSVQIARLEERLARAIESSDKRMERMEADLSAMRETVDQVLTEMHQARGGWRMLLLVGGGAAAFGSLLTNFIEKLKG